MNCEYVAAGLVWGRFCRKTAGESGLSNASYGGFVERVLPAVGVTEGPQALRTEALPDQPRAQEQIFFELIFAQARRGLMNVGVPAQKHSRALHFNSFCPTQVQTPPEFFFGAQVPKKQVSHNRVALAGRKHEVEHVFELRDFHGIERITVHR